MKKKLFTLENILETLSPNFTKKFAPGISFEEIENFTCENQISLTDETKILYNWKNGIIDYYAEGISQIQLFSLGIFLSLKDAYEHYYSMAIDEKLWPKEYFPIFTSGWGDYYLVKQFDPKPHDLEIYFYSPALLFIKPTSIFDSLKILISCVEEAYRNKILSRNTNDELVIADEYFKFMKARNPNSEYWKGDNMK